MAIRDFLDEVVDERTARNSGFPAMVEAAEWRRKLPGALADKLPPIEITDIKVARQKALRGKTE